MKITAKMFEKSFYSFGAGLDIQPMMRFTHLTDTFISANLFLDKELVIKWYERSFRWYGFEILDKKIISDFDEREYFELSPDCQAHLTNPDFISVNDLKDYQNTFRNALGLAQYALVYKLFKKTTGRTLTWYFFTGEGVASYVALSQNGRFAPRIISTIETGVLEHPESLLNNFFRNSIHKRPLLWIRGFEPRYSSLVPRNDALNETGVFSARALDFNQTYNCGWCYKPRQKTTVRHCKGFVTPQTFNLLKKLKFRDEFINEKHRFYEGALEENKENVNSGDIILTDRNFRSDIKYDGVKQVFVEELLDYEPDWKNRNHVEHDRYLVKIFERLNQLNISNSNTIHIIPFIMEDAGELWFNILKDYPFRSITYIKNPFDLIDMKATKIEQGKVPDEMFPECYTEII